MIKRMIFLALVLLLLAGCSNQSHAEFQESAGSSTDSGFLTEKEAESKVEWLIYFGTFGDKNIINIDSEDGSYIITLDNDMILTMEKETGIIYCVENQGQKSCDEGYITYLDGGIIFDTDTFSCVPGEPKAAADDSGMKCNQEIIDKYNSLKEQLAARKQG